MNENKENQNQIKLEITPQTKTSYSNLVVISHSQSEFVMDFASTLPGYTGPQVNDRIILTPDHAKRLLNALFDNISKYEATYGLIDVNGTIGLSKGYNFGAFGPNENKKS